MSQFETLIFIPEGSLFDERTAERNALRQTLKELGGELGPAERLKYAAMQEQTKLLGLADRVRLILQTFFKKEELAEALEVFTRKLQQQNHLVKDAIPFLDEVKDEVNLVLLAKETKAVAKARMQESELLNYFSAAYFKDDYDQFLPAKTVLTEIVQAEKLAPATCLVIGTDLAEEIQGAENANLQSLWLAPKKVKMPISPRPTLHLNKLSDLLFYLELN